MGKCKIGVLISGGGTNLQAIIDATESGVLNVEVTLVVSNRAKAYGLERAKNHNIHGVYIGKKVSPDFEARSMMLLKELEEQKVDLIVLAGYLEILHPQVIEKYRDRIINIHPALIPKYCGKGFYGMHVHEAVKKNNEKFSGATVHFVDEGVDTGQMILQEVVRLSEEDSAEEIQKKVLKVEHRVLIQGINKFINGEI